MNIHMVVIAYGLAKDTKALVERVLKDSKHDVTVHLFLHSQYEDVVKVVGTLGKRKGVSVYDYGFNRGLAKSWNEGMLNAYGAGADTVLIVNDDMLPEAGDFDKVAEAAVNNRDKYVVYGFMHDKRTGRDTDTGFGFFAINPIALETIGVFDEQFIPIYFEDTDYSYRARISGLHNMAVTDTTILHQGSANIHTVPGLKEQNQKTYRANYRYFLSKWGGEPGKEKFIKPFNDLRFSTRIAPCDRERPYWGYERKDLEGLVKI